MNTKRCEAHWFSRHKFKIRNAMANQHFIYLSADKSEGFFPLVNSETPSMRPINTLLHHILLMDVESNFASFIREALEQHFPIDEAAFDKLAGRWVDSESLLAKGHTAISPEQSQKIAQHTHHEIWSLFFSALGTDYDPSGAMSLETYNALSILSEVSIYHFQDVYLVNHTKNEFVHRPLTESLARILFEADGLLVLDTLAMLTLPFTFGKVILDEEYPLKGELGSWAGDLVCISSEAPEGYELSLPIFIDHTFRLRFNRSPDESAYIAKTLMSQFEKNNGYNRKIPNDALQFRALLSIEGANSLEATVDVYPEESGYDDLTTVRLPNCKSRVDSISYADNDGLICPSCAGNEIGVDEGSLTRSDFGMLMVENSCMECDATWTELAKVVGYNNLERAEDIDVIEMSAFLISECIHTRDLPTVFEQWDGSSIDCKQVLDAELLPEHVNHLIRHLTEERKLDIECEVITHKKYGFTQYVLRFGAYVMALTDYNDDDDRIREELHTIKYFTLPKIQSQLGIPINEYTIGS